MSGLSQSPRENVPAQPKSKQLEVDGRLDSLSFIKKLGEMSADGLSSYLKENLQLPQLTEQQVKRLASVGILLNLATAFRESLSQDSSGKIFFDRDGARPNVQRIIAGLMAAQKEIFKNPYARLKDVLPPSVLDSLENPTQMLNSRVIPSINIRDVVGGEQFERLQIYVLEALGSLGRFDLGRELVDTAFLPEVKDKKEEIKMAGRRTTFEMDYSDLTSAAEIRLYQHFDSMVEAGAPKEKVRQILHEAALDFADREMTRRAYLDFDESSLPPDKALLWEKAQDMFDLKNELGTLSDSTEILLDEISREVVLLVAMLVIPEFLILHVGAGVARAAESISLSRKAAAFLRTGRLAKYYDQFMTAERATQLAGMGSRALLRGAIGTVAEVGLTVLLGDVTLMESVEQEPWVKKAVLNMAANGYLKRTGFDSVSRMRIAGLLRSLTSSAANSLASRLTEMGSKPAVSYLLLESLKAGEFNGDPHELINFVGPDLYDFCGKPTLETI